MAKKLTDDEAMEMAYRKLFGDLDTIESRELFDGAKMDETGMTAPNAEPESKGSGGIKVTIEPMMHAAQESAKMSSGDDDEEEEDHLKGIGGMSSLMSRLHGER